MGLQPFCGQLSWFQSSINSLKKKKKKQLSRMVGKMLFITETSSYNKLDVLKASRVIRFADNSDLGMAGSILGDGI